MPATDNGHVNQGLRRRLAALDSMVSGRLEGFAERHAELDPDLAGDVDLLSKQFHATLHEAYDAFRESGDRHELMRTLRGALAEARSGLSFLSAAVQGGQGGAPGGDPTLAVDPGPDLADGEAGSGTVPGAPGSGVTVAVTPLPPPDPAAAASGGQDALKGILAQIVAQFGDLLGGLEELIDGGFEEGGPSFKLAVNLYAEFQFGGSSLGGLFDGLS